MCSLNIGVISTVSFPFWNKSLAKYESPPVISVCGPKDTMLRGIPCHRGQRALDAFLGACEPRDELQIDPPVDLVDLSSDPDHRGTPKERT